MSGAHFQNTPLLFAPKLKSSFDWKRKTWIKRLHFSPVLIDECTFSNPLISLLWSSTKKQLALTHFSKARSGQGQYGESVIVFDIGCGGSCHRGPGSPSPVDHRRWHHYRVRLQRRGRLRPAVPRGVQRKHFRIRSMVRMAKSMRGKMIRFPVWSACI